MPNTSKSIFISYAWGGESENVANEIDDKITALGLNFIRDKRDLGFKGLIKEFMEQIGSGQFVVLIISDKYLKSPNCMFELLEVQKKGNIYDRILPVVISDANIYKSIGIISYLKYWEDQIDELNQALKGLESYADTQGIRDDIDLYTDIRGAIAELASLLRNMNTLNLDELRSREYAPLLELLDVQDVTQSIVAPHKEPKNKQGKILYHIPDMMQLDTWTRCIVRLAWDEIILEEGLDLNDREKVIENIRLGKVMEVCIEETKEEDNFDISTNSSKEQFISEDDFTEWIFEVKAKKEGTFTLVIKVSLIQIIEGFGERKKDIVLERNVKTEAFAPEAVPQFDSVLETFSSAPNRQLPIAPPASPSPMASPAMPIPTPPPSAEAPGKRLSFKRIMPYAASIMLLCIASVTMWPDLKSELTEDSAIETTVSDSDLPQTTPLPNPVEEPMILPEDPNLIESPQEFPVSPGISIELPKSKLVLIGIKQNPETSFTKMEENDFLFLVDYLAIDSLQTQLGKVTIYELSDTVRYSGLNIQKLNAIEIKDVVREGKPIQNWKLNTVKKIQNNAVLENH